MPTEIVFLNDGPEVAAMLDWAQKRHAQPRNLDEGEAFLAGIRWERERVEAIRMAKRDAVLNAIEADVGKLEDL